MRGDRFSVTMATVGEAVPFSRVNERQQIRSLEVREQQKVKSAHSALSPTNRGPTVRSTEEGILHVHHVPTVGNFITVKIHISPRPRCV